MDNLHTCIVKTLLLVPQVQGNDALKRGLQLRKKFYLRQAQEFYSQGLAMRCGDSAVDALLYSNRAQVCPDTRCSRTPEPRTRL